MKSKCWSCSHEWESYGGGCPISCPECGESCCPECGGEMGRTIDGDEMDQYTAGGCYSCSHTCCGGCI
jgi:hypothetical protein